jgi:hypothetical protein
VRRREARTSASCLVPTGGGGVPVDKAPAASVGEIGSPGALQRLGLLPCLARAS